MAQSTNKIKLIKAPDILDASLTLPISKSLSNRLILLSINSDHPQWLNHMAISSARDSQILKSIFSINVSKNINVYDAGTVARFVSTWAAFQAGKEHSIYGTDRMHERPMKPLFKALRRLGAGTQFLGNKDHLPARIRGSESLPRKVEIDGTLSSQFVSALMLNAINYDEGMWIDFGKNVASKPYIEMTAKCILNCGHIADFKGNSVLVKKGDGRITNAHLFQESDWSAAIYFLLLPLFIPGEIRLTNFYEKSWQGDSKILKPLRDLGLSFRFDNHKLIANKQGALPKKINLNLENSPDLAQPLVCALAALNVPFKFSGLGTLIHKETNRIKGLVKNLDKLGFVLGSDEECISFKGVTKKDTQEKEIVLESFKDHRMAMSSLFLLLKHENACIESPEVVEKSYPEFWRHLQQQIGFSFS